MYRVWACVLAVTVMLPSVASAAGTGNDRCVSTINNDARKVFQAAAKQDRSCVKRATVPDVTGCVDGADAATDLKQSTLTNHFVTQCAGNAPAFGLAAGGAASINAAAEGSATAIAHDLFGPVVTVGSGTLPRCQEKVLQRAGQLGVTIWREFRKCKAKNLSGFTDHTALAAGCLGGPNGPQPDPTAKIAKGQTRLAGDVRKRCIDQGISPGPGAFPGACGAASNPTFAQCVGRQVRCRLCEAIKSADGLTDADLSCDNFDDGLGNSSCGLAPTATVTPILTATSISTPQGTATGTPPFTPIFTATSTSTPDGTATETQPPVPTASSTRTRTPTITATPTATAPPTPTPPATATATLPAICAAIVGLPPIAQVPVTLLQGSSQCGGAGLTSPTPGPPYAGSVKDGSNATLAQLSLGCLYTGALPPLLLPYGSSTEVSVVGLQLLPLALTLGGSAGSGPADCTLGAGPGRSCANGAPGLNGSGACNFDNDCGGQVTSCALDANCFFGPPIPVPNGGLSACVMNAFLTDICGQVTLAPPAATFHAALSSRVYLTFNAASPCPLCDAGVCSAGERAGLGCSAAGSAGTSADCPPLSSQFLSTLTVVIPALTSGQSTLTASDGFFCAGQSVPGAMGLTAARTVTEQGSGPTLPLLSTALSMNIAGTFCIEPTGTFLDAIAGLPAVGAISTGAEVDITNVLP